MIVALLLLALQAQAAPDVISGIRVHGNHATAEADVLSIAGIAVGEPGTEAHVHAARERLEASGRFERVEVRRRFASIDDPTQVLVVIIVDERAGATADDPTPGGWTRLSAKSMWLPILAYEDGYGFTYGARVTFVGVAGRDSRISVPLAWGGERRAMAEFEKRFERGPLTRVAAGAGWTRSENPHYGAAESRGELEIVAERAFAGSWRASASASTAEVSFADVEQTIGAVGAGIAFDTRVDPAFPRNAVLVNAGWERLFTGGASFPRWSAEAQGFVGMPRAMVLAVRARTALSPDPLPLPERALLGGARSVRGVRAGYDAGDNMAAASVELRVPLTSPLRIGRFGAKAFVDAGTTWDAGESMRDQAFVRGVGGGLFVGATIFSAGVDLAWARDGKARVHAGLGLTF